MNSLELMKKRLIYYGGTTTKERMVKDKYNSLIFGLSNSYQSCTVKKLDSTLTAKALINPNVVKQDYDDKIISVPFDSKYDVGDIFIWVDTDTKWLIYTQELTELAYFRGGIRRCRWQINAKDKNGTVKSTWLYARGPVETKIDTATSTTHAISLDVPNETLSILVPNNDFTAFVFQKYKRFILNGIAWQIQSIDNVSLTNIIQVEAQEYFINKDTDNLTDNVADDPTIVPAVPTDESPITGTLLIKPFGDYEYTVQASGGTWKILESNMPIIIKSQTDTSIIINWNKGKSGKFTLQYVNTDNTIISKSITVESLF